MCGLKSVMFWVVMVVNVLLVVRALGGGLDGRSQQIII